MKTQPNNKKSHDLKMFNPWLKTYNIHVSPCYFQQFISKVMMRW